MKTQNKIVKLVFSFFFGLFFLMACQPKNNNSNSSNNSLEVSKKKIENQESIARMQQTSFKTDTVYDIIWNFSEHDFGEVKQGTTPSFDFTFTVLDGMAQITGSRTYCGCTVPAWEPIEFTKGDSYSITVEFNTENKMGMFNESVDLFFNRSQIPEKLTVKGVIVE